MSVFGLPRRRVATRWDAAFAGGDPHPLDWDMRELGAGPHPCYTIVSTAEAALSVRDPKPGHLIIQQRASGAGFGGYTTPIPDGDLLMAWRIDGMATRYALSGTSASYIALAASTSAATGSGTQLISGIVYIPNNGQWRIYSQKWTNWSTFSTTYAGPLNVTLHGESLWLTMRRQGTTWYSGVSPDLRAIITEFSTTEATLGATPTRMGPCWYNPLADTLHIAAGPIVVRQGPGLATDEHLDVQSTPFKAVGGSRYWYEQPL